MINLKSDNVPDVDYSPPMGDLFGFFSFNWQTLSPVVWLLGGVFFGFFVIKLLLIKFRGD
jgi:hypothetical protein